MAVYDLTQGIPSTIKSGDVLNVPYSGAAIGLLLPKGEYLFECWGAQGGSYDSTYCGGKGGYSKGTLTLNNEQNIIIRAGGSPSGTSGGFNGGGSATSYKGGGGASDIRVGRDSLYARIIVAGGGGGAANYNSTLWRKGGVGGGTSGGKSDGADVFSTWGGYGGTQTGPFKSSSYNGAFGLGGSGQASGGGGGWYGGDSGYFAIAAGGGSGYVFDASTAVNYPSGCLLDASQYLVEAETLAGDTAFNGPDGASETGHSGNGYVRITAIKATSTPDAPSNLTCDYDYFGASLIWSASEDATGYNVYINGSLVGTTSDTKYEIRGLNCDTEYTFGVTAYNSDGESESVAEVSIRTGSSNLTQISKEYQSIQMAWDASSKASGYKLYRDGDLVATIPGSTHTYEDTGLLPSHTYRYVLKAYYNSTEGLSGTLDGKTKEAFYRQGPVFKSVLIADNPTVINTSITLSVSVSDELVIFEPEKFYSDELFSGEV